MPPRGALWLAIVLGLASGPVHAAWSPIGPDGGHVVGLAIAASRPQTLYAVTLTGGAFRSDDGGATWHGLGLAGQCGQALAVDPRSSSTVYVATSLHCSNTGGRLWRSRDAGVTWELANAGLWYRRRRGARAVLALAMSRRPPARIYAGVSPGVARSRDGGTTWRVRSSAARGGDVAAIAVDPRNARTVYGGGYAGVFRSVDGGRRWTPSGEGLGEQWVHALAIDPTAAETLYAATDGGLFKSANAAATWLPTGPTGLAALAVGLEPRSPNTVYAAFDKCSGAPCSAGVWKSTDAGATWIEAGEASSPERVRTLAVHPSRSGRLYVGTEDLGVFRSSDGGATWQRSRGLTALGTPSIAVDNDGRLFAGTRLGVMHRTDGEAWQPGTSGQPADEWAQIVAVAGDRAYAGFRSGLYESRDWGVSWERTTFRGGSVSAISIARDESLYVGTTGDGHRVVGTVWLSADRGLTWTRAGFGSDVDQSVTAIAVDPNDTGVIYAGTWNRGLHKSTNAGKTWGRLRNGLASQRVLAVAIDRTDRRNVFAGLGDFVIYNRGGEDRRIGGLFRSTDAGESWTPLGELFRGVTVTALLQHPAAPDRWWAATTRGVYESRDHGETWRRLGSGLVGRRVASLAIDVRQPARLFAGTDDNGVHVHPIGE